MLAAVLLLSSLSLAGDPPAVPPLRTRAEALQRWQRMSSAERAEMQRRFEALENLDADSRRELDQRLAALRQAAVRARESTPPNAKSQLEELKPRLRDSVEREWIEQAFAERGREMLDRLPARVQQRLLGLEGDELVQEVRQLRRDFRGRLLDGALDRLSGELGLGRQEHQRLKQLPPEDRLKKLLGLRRRQLMRRARQQGITPEEWERLRDMPDAEFHREWLQRIDPELRPQRNPSRRSLVCGCC